MIRRESSAVREGLAIARMAQARSKIKSRAQVKKRKISIKYTKIPKNQKIPVVKIRKWERWQFPSDAFAVSLKKPLELWRYYMPDDPSPKKKNKHQKTITDSPIDIANFLLTSRCKCCNNELEHFDIICIFCGTKVTY
jgi:hypothetical protein